jgi:hypothetical protein
MRTEKCKQTIEKLQNRAKFFKKEKTTNNKIKVTNIETKEDIIYIGLRKASKAMHITDSTIYKYSESGETYKGYKFEIIPKSTLIN